LYNEADTRAKLIDPAIHARGWSEDLIKREETAGAIEIAGGAARRKSGGRIDYTLRVRIAPDAQPVAVALVEAKAENLPAGHGLEQAKAYASSKRLNVPFVFASNGRQFVEFDRSSGLTAPPRPLADFPTPADLRARYEAAKGFSLADPAARPLVTRYAGGEGSRRYYQDAAIRATLEKIAAGETRALLSLATGAGKTYIAVNLLKRIADAGLLRRALFVCDRDELRAQGVAAFQNVFGSDAAAVSGGDPAKNARVLVATYQTLDVDSDEADATFLVANYPPNYFSHIVVDECHRSAWGKWSQVFTRNPAAVQVGLTATPRQLTVPERTKEAAEDEKINADNLKHFGEPVYEYDLGQGIEDGYLAACEIVRRDIFLDGKQQSERESGIARGDLTGKRLTDTVTGAPRIAAETREAYVATSFEDRLLLPDRVNAMAQDLFDYLFIATTVDLLTTGVDVPSVRNIVFFKYVRSPIAFYQMVGRGTRLDPVTGKLMFRVYDYTDATRLFGHAFLTRYAAPPTAGPGPGDVPPVDSPPRDNAIQVEGFTVHVTDAGRYIVTTVDGKAMPVTVEEYEERLTAALVTEAPTLGTFRARWVAPPARRDLLGRLPDGGRSAGLVRALREMDAYDLYDVLAELGYGLDPRTRQERADAFGYKNRDWLSSMPPATAAVVQAIAAQFAQGGTEELERPQVFDLRAVAQAGGLAALRQLGKPADVLTRTKERLFVG